MICELYNDHFQNFKRYNIPKAQLIIADIPYNIGTNAYGSSPSCLVAYGDNNIKAIEKSGISGTLIRLRGIQWNTNSTR